LIGAPTEARTFTTITGAGTISNQGGSNTYNNAAGSSFQATGGKATVVSGNFKSLTLNGAFLGGSKMSADSADFTAGFLNGGIQLSVSSLNLRGTIEIDDDGTTLLVSNSAQIPMPSLITMTGGSSFQFGAGSHVTQNQNFQIVPGAPKPKKPSVTINGQWLSSAGFSVAEVPISGTGVYTISAAGSWNLNNVVFSGKSIDSQGSIQTQIGSLTVPDILGAGTISCSASLNMNIDHLAANSFTLNSGNVNVMNTTLNSLDIKNGIFTLATMGKITTFTFDGGQLKGSQAKQAVVTVRDTVIQGVTTQTLTNAALTTSTFTMNCGTQACQFFSQNASVRTVTAKR